MLIYPLGRCVGDSTTFACFSQHSPKCCVNRSCNLAIDTKEGWDVIKKTWSQYVEWQLREISRGQNRLYVASAWFGNYHIKTLISIYLNRVGGYDGSDDGWTTLNVSNPGVSSYSQKTTRKTILNLTSNPRLVGIERYVGRIISQNQIKPTTIQSLLKLAWPRYGKFHISELEDKIVPFEFANESD